MKLLETGAIYLSKDILKPFHGSVFPYLQLLFMHLYLGFTPDSILAISKTCNKMQKPRGIYLGAFFVTKTVNYLVNLSVFKIASNSNM